MSKVPRSTSDVKEKVNWMVFVVVAVVVSGGSVLVTLTVLMG